MTSYYVTVVFDLLCESESRFTIYPNPDFFIEYFLDGHLSSTVWVSQYQKKNIYLLVPCICWVIQCLSVTSGEVFSILPLVLHPSLCNTCIFLVCSLLYLKLNRPCRLNLFCCSNVIISSLPCLSLLHINLPFALTPHVHDAVDMKNGVTNNSRYINNDLCDIFIAMCA